MTLDDRELRAWTERGKAPAGSCPFCASLISMVQRDGFFRARCSHRGCGATGPKMRSITRAADLFCCPPQRTAGGSAIAPRITGAALAAELEIDPTRARQLLAELRAADLAPQARTGADGRALAGLIARPTPDEARSIGRVAEHLRGLAAEVEPSRMADGFKADRMRLLAHRLRQVAALMPDSDEARRLVEEAIGAGMALACHGDWSDEQRAVDRARAATARTALLRALGVEA